MFILTNNLYPELLEFYEKRTLGEIEKVLQTDIIYISKYQTSDKYSGAPI